MFAKVLFVTSVIRAVLAGSNCVNGNNCQRALLRTILPDRDPLADCLSYFRVTYTPPTSTVINTVFVTETVTVRSDSQKREENLQARQVTVTASDIPAYASPCSGAVKYSSACSCIGATPSTITLEPPLTTGTTTVTVTTTTTRQPSLQTLAFGEGLGFQNDVSGVQKSFPLNSQSGTGCNRFGWYLTPTVSQLQGGISGPLYVLVDDQQVDVGIWVATANAQGRVTVTYLLNPPYALAEVHVDLACLPIDSCIETGFTYNAGAIPNLPTWSNPTPLVFPTCSGGSVAYLIVFSNVNILKVV